MAFRFEIESHFGAFYTGGSVAWTADGEELLCQDGNKINVISVNGNTVQRTIGVPLEQDGNIDEDTVYTFALSADDSYVVTSHRSGLLKLWQRTDGTLLKQWKGIHQGPVPRLAFSGSGKLIASGGTDSSIRLWDYLQKVCVGALRGCQGVISVLSFHPLTGTQPYIVAAGDDHKINCWNYETKETQAVLTGHFSKVTAVSFSQDGQSLVSSSRDKVLILWDLVKGSQIRVVPAYECLEGVVMLNANTKLPDGVKLSDDKLYAASAGENGTVKIWNMTGGKLLYEQQNSLITKADEDAPLAITHLLHNEKCSQIALISADHNIMIHNLSTFFCSKQLIGFSDEILDIVHFGKKGRYLAVATNSHSIKVYDTTTMNCQVLNGHTDIVLSLAAFKNFLLSSGKDSTIRLWQIDPGTFTVTLLGTGTKHTSSVGSVAFGKLSHTICASVSQDTCLKVWTIPKTFEADKILSLSCSATQIAHEKDVNCVTISPNDKMIATASQDKIAKLWSSKDLSLVGVFRGHKRGIWCVRFSPVDQVLLTTSADCTMRLWSLTDMSCLKSFEGHESSILKAEFITVGMQILSAGSDGLLKVWSIKTSECLTTLDKHESRIWALAIAHDETYFYSGGSDSQLIKWKDVTEEKKIAVQLEEQEIALQEQELFNLLGRKKLLKALCLALRLDKPLLSLRIITDVIKNQEQGLAETITKLNDTHKQSLLKHAATWNTNSKNCRPAQLVIQIILNEILVGTFKPTGLSKLIEDTLPYTERHFKRMTEYLKDLKFLEYTLKCMQPHANLDVDMK